jgi:hypothetical protein
LGINHVDQVLVRQIGLTLLKKGYDIILYEDLPYAALGYFNYEESYNSIIKNNFRPYFMEIDIENKILDLTLYSTQVSDSWLKDIKNYSYSLKENKFYERFWQPTQRNENLLDNMINAGVRNTNG